MTTIQYTQEYIEQSHTKKASREYVLELMRADPSCLNMIGDGIELIEAWAAEPATYKSKQERKDTVNLLNLKDIVEKLFTDVLLIRSSATLASMASRLGQTLGFADNRQGITLAAEILAVLMPVGLYVIQPLRKNGQWHVIPTIELSPEERMIAERGMYVPPSIEKPRTVRSNRDSGYKYLKGTSLILGGPHHHHEGNICLDVINTQNKIPLSLDFEFIDNVTEERKTPIQEIAKNMREEGKTAHEIKLAIEQEQLNWQMHQLQSNYLYDLMDATGNQFYITNKVDKRGRLYAQGHHINPMGSSYKKSAVNLARTEKIEVPEGFFK